MRKDPPISRRSLIAGLGAAIPASAVTAVPVLAGTDPIFAAIQAHKAAWFSFGEAISATCQVEEVLFDRGLRGPGLREGVVVGQRRKLECTKLENGFRFEENGPEEPITAYSHEEVDQHFDALLVQSDWTAAERARCHAGLDAQGESIVAGERELGWPEAKQRQDAASEASWGAWYSLLATRPSTLAGLLALVEYAAHHDDGDTDEGRAA